MARVKRGFKARRRRNRVLEECEGFYSTANQCFTLAIERRDRALARKFKDRKRRKRDFRALWTIRINAAARQCGTTYSRLIGALKKSQVDLDRKSLADLAMNDQASFAKLVEQVAG